MGIQNGAVTVKNCTAVSQKTKTKNKNRIIKGFSHFIFGYIFKRTKRKVLERYLLTHALTALLTIGKSH